ncbi:hypothetical protein [Deinococcus petrolearius]|uniref:Uncharacterized protein n=1 Tax=Deinococcus petrolearius TaxID=1751295 RepID=A0ABW1DD49_9DEIO
MRSPRRRALPAPTLLDTLRAHPAGLTHPEVCDKQRTAWADTSAGLWRLVDRGRAEALPEPAGSGAAYRFRLTPQAAR